MRWFVWILLLFCVQPVIGQQQMTASDRLRPQWMHRLPVPSNPSFVYIVEHAEGRTLEEAREGCLLRLADNRQLMNTVQATSERDMEKEVHQLFVNGKLQERIDNRSTVRVKVQGNEVELTANRLDEYWEYVLMGGEWRYICYTFYAVASSDLPPVFDDVTFSTKYGMRGFVRSLVPGWGQMYKGSTAKGLCILGGEVVLAGAVIATESLRASYRKKMREQPRFFQKYNTKADNWANVRNVCIGAAAAVYVYNLIDAIVAPGAKRAVVRRAPLLTMTPVAYESGGGIGLALVF